MSIGAGFGPFGRNRNFNRENPSCTEEGEVRPWCARLSCSLHPTEMRYGARLKLWLKTEEMRVESSGEDRRRGGTPKRYDVNLPASPSEGVSASEYLRRLGIE
jgi:hypothetical protein